MLDEEGIFNIAYSCFADVAELADAQASGACGLYARGGSTPLIRILLGFEVYSFYWPIKRIQYLCGFKSMSILRKNRFAGR